MSNNSVEYLLSLKDQFSTGIKKATTNTEKLNNAVNSTQRSLSSLGGALGIGLGVAGVVNFGKSVLESLKNYEYFSASLRTLMLGDAKAAKSLETQLISLAATTPFSLVEIQDATKQLLAYGFAAGSITKNIRMLGDVASALKIPFGDIAYLYGTLRTQGRAFSKDIYQFTARGIPIVKELAKQFGVADSEVMKLVEDGKVGFKEVEKAFQSMTAEGGMFFDMMTQQSKTVGGQLSNLGDNWEQLKVEIGKSQTGIIASTVSFINEYVGILANGFKRGNQEVANYNKFGAESFATWKVVLDKTANILTGWRVAEIQEQTHFQDALYKMYVDSPAQTLESAYKRKAELYNLLKNQSLAFLQGEISKEEYFRKRATVKGAIEEVSGSISNFMNTGKKDPSVSDTAKGASTSKAGTSTTAVESRGVQNFNISINKLVEQITVKATTIKEGSSEIKDAVAEALLAAVNDFSLLATK